MKNIIIGFLVLVSVLGGCATIPIPSNFVEKASSDFNIDIKLYSQALYSPGEYGFDAFKGWKSKSLVGPLNFQEMRGILVCTDDRVLFIMARHETYDIVLESKYDDIVDVLVPSWGRSRRLVIECKLYVYTFTIISKAYTGGYVSDKEGTYDFYRFIATKAGLKIKPGFEKSMKEKGGVKQEVPAAPEIEKKREEELG